MVSSSSSSTADNGASHPTGLGKKNLSHKSPSTGVFVFFFGRWLVFFGWRSCFGRSGRAVSSTCRSCLAPCPLLRCFLSGASACVEAAVPAAGLMCPVSVLWVRAHGGGEGGMVFPVQPGPRSHDTHFFLTHTMVQQASRWSENSLMRVRASRPRFFSMSVIRSAHDMLRQLTSLPAFVPTPLNADLFAHAVFDCSFDVQAPARHERKTSTPSPAHTGSRPSDFPKTGRR